MARYRSLYERLVANTRVDGRTMTLKPHRLMLEITTGYYFPFDEAGHYKCFNPLCINPDHLRIETMAENLSSRRGYKPCEGRWIPVLFPTPERELQDAADAAWNALNL